MTDGSSPPGHDPGPPDSLLVPGPAVDPAVRSGEPPTSVLHGPDGAPPTVGFDPHVGDGPGGLLGSANHAVADGLHALGGLLGWARRVVGLIALVVTAGGVLALALGLWAWHDAVVPMLVVAALCAPAIIAPQVLRRRIGALVETATNPAEAAGQARDLLGRVKPGGELRTAVDHLRSVDRPVRGGRVRGALLVARATSAVVGLAQPDPERHRLLLPLRPERITTLATWGFAAFWGSIVAAVVAVAAVVVLVL